MALTGLRINHLGLREVARSREVARELLRRGHKVAERARSQAPEGQIVDLSPYLGRNRARVSVFAPFGLATDQATRWLGSSIDAARG